MTANYQIPGCDPWHGLSESERAAVVQAARRGQRGSLTAAEARQALDYAERLRRCGYEVALAAVVNGATDLWIIDAGVHRMQRFIGQLRDALVAAKAEV